MQDKFTAAELAAFDRQGVIIVRGLADAALCGDLRALAEDHLARQVAPIELEAAVRYPGAPESVSAPGGRTARRLLQAWQRGGAVRRWAASPAVVGRLQQLLGEQVVFVQAHHNCIMTKHPDYSSLTNWHQDMRYWSFERADLVSVWLALGPEYPENGSLSFIPGTHRMEFAPERYDEAKFLRPELPENQTLIDTRILPRLEAGDAVFFHCRTFHAANRNATTAVKFSPVFTYHGVSNRPLPGTRSISHPEIPLPLV